MKIGIRTLKTGIGVGLSIGIAQFVGLNFFTAAGILTILCIDVTKKRSLRTALNRFLACISGLLVSGAFFELFGYHPWILALYIIVFIPVLLKLKIQDGFVTSSVIVLHVFSLKQISLPILWNEFQIIVIGMGVALIMNSYMPSLKEELIGYQKEIEEKFKKILYEFSVYLEDGDQGWTGKELLEVDKLLNQAKSLAIRDVENHLVRKQNKYYFYFEMREKQFEILGRMLPIISTLSMDVLQRKMFALFLLELSENVHSGNTALLSLEKLNTKRKEMKKLPLPTTREEFETRASLFHLMNEMDLYLQIKAKFSPIKA